MEMPETKTNVFNPDMLIIARESRGITQSELASVLNISQGKISKVENGLLSASEEMVKSFSVALDYPEDFFFFPDQVYGVGVGLVFHRKRQSLTNKFINKLHADMNIRRIHIERLLRSVTIQHDLMIRSMDIDEYKSVEDIARSVRAAWHIPRGPVKNVTQTIENAGGIIFRWDFGTNLLDAISQWIPGLPPMFFVNSRFPADRIRFSLAHELGHIIMHRVPTPEMEEQADHFAAEFLMPAEDIGPYLNNVSLPKIASLKPFWKVSMGALLVRAKSLSKVNDKQYSYYWMQMGKAGYRTKEPPELDIPIEEPTFLKELFDVHRNELGYSVSDIRSMFRISDGQFRMMYSDQKTPLSIVEHLV